MRVTKHKLLFFSGGDEIFLSLDKLQCADIEFDSKAFQIKKHQNSSSAAVLQDKEQMQ